MSFTEDEQLFIQKQDAPNFPSYLKSVWYFWPTLKYSQARRKASKLWKARKEWLNTLEPTPARLNKNSATSHSSFHQICPPFVPITEETPIGNSILTVTHWEAMLEPELNEPLEGQKNDVICLGCKEGQLNQLGHMDYGGCLYYDSCEMDLADPIDMLQSKLPPLPASPRSTD